MFPGRTGAESIEGSITTSKVPPTVSRRAHKHGSRVTAFCAFRRLHYVAGDEACGSGGVTGSPPGEMSPEGMKEREPKEAPGLGGGLIGRGS